VKHICSVSLNFFVNSWRFAYKAFQVLVNEASLHPLIKKRGEGKRSSKESLGLQHLSSAHHEESGRLHENQSNLRPLDQSLQDVQVVVNLGVFFRSDATKFKVY